MSADKRFINQYVFRQSLDQHREVNKLSRQYVTEWVNISVFYFKVTGFIKLRIIAGETIYPDVYKNMNELSESSSIKAPKTVIFNGRTFGFSLVNIRDI